VAAVPAPDQFPDKANLSVCICAVVPGQGSKDTRVQEEADVREASDAPRECMEAARWMLLEAAQKVLPQWKMESLMAKRKTVQCELGTERTLLVVGGCNKKYMKVANNKEYLPVLPEAHPLSRLYMLDSHARDHGSVDSMVMWLRDQVWIMVARRLAKQIRGRCFTCKYLAKKGEEQLTGPLPEHRMRPIPIFESTAVDLFRPLTFQDPYNKRRMGKAWESSLSALRLFWYMWR
jgi:hypothetical protein